MEPPICWADTLWSSVDADVVVLGVVVDILSCAPPPLHRYKGGSLGRELGPCLAGLAPYTVPLLWLWGWMSHFKGSSALSLQPPVHEKAPKSQNKGLSRLTSPAWHLAQGLIKGNRVSWSESEE